MTRAIDWTGKRIGKLVAVRRVSTSRNGHARWLCNCDCGGTHEVLSTHLMGGKIYHCGCESYTGTKRDDWGGHGDISGDFWSSIKRGANGGKGRRQIEMSVSIEDAWDIFLEQDKSCAVSGLPLNFTHENGVRVRDTKTASLDRIDSAKGYTKENVQWTHKDINLMKGRLDEDYFVELCTAVAENSKKK